MQIYILILEYIYGLTSTVRTKGLTELGFIRLSGLDLLRIEMIMIWLIEFFFDLTCVLSQYVAAGSI